MAMPCWGDDMVLVLVLVLVLVVILTTATTLFLMMGVLRGMPAWRLGLVTSVGSGPARVSKQYV